MAQGSISVAIPKTREIYFMDPKRECDGWKWTNQYHSLVNARVSFVAWDQISESLRATVSAFSLQDGSNGIPKEKRINMLS